MAGRNTLNQALGATVVVGVLAAGGTSAFVMQDSRPVSQTGAIVSPVSAAIQTLKGQSLVATAGATLPIGARLTTGPNTDAGATIQVGDRELLLGANTSIVRESERSFTLERGSVVGTGEGGSPFQLRSDQTIIKPAAHSTWRVDRGFTTRVVSYSGRVVASTDSGASIDIDSLHQASAAGTALPEEPGPLSLTPGDARERLVAPTLVSLDSYLSRVAAGLDTDATHSTELVTLVNAVVGKSRYAEAISERLMPALIAQATDHSVKAAYAEARMLRADGGSWGVVAALTGVTQIDPLQQVVANLIDLTKAAASQTPTPAATSAAPTTGSGSHGDGNPGGEVAASPQPSSAPSPQGSDSSTPTSSPTPTGAPTATPPSPSTGGSTPDPGLVGGLIDVINQLLGGHPSAS